MDDRASTIELNITRGRASRGLSAVPREGSTRTDGSRLPLLPPTLGHQLMCRYHSLRFGIRTGLLFGLACLLASGQVRAEDAVDRLTESHLARVRQAIEGFAAARKELAIPSRYRGVRANLHVHSELSHDSNGKLEEIVPAAKAAGSEVLLFTDHPSPESDVFLDGPQGFRDGVLLIPGAETKGLLVYPTLSLRPFEAAEPQELTQIVRNRGGHVFLSHLEERMDWELQNLTGVEIYNTHADFKKQARLVASLRNPLWLLKVNELLQRYPQETFSALQAYPEDYLRRWDELCRLRPHTGIAANDAHQNVGIRIQLGEDNQVVIEDPLGEELIKLNRLLVAPLLAIPVEARVGDVLFRMQLDPYENSLRHAGTHLLVTELSRAAVWEALERGRAHVAFDWIADSKGFYVALRDRSATATNEASTEIGGERSWSDNLVIQGQSPLSAKWRLLRDGEVIREAAGVETFEAEVDRPGIYRVELWLTVADQPQPWILANPFYVRP